MQLIGRAHSSHVPGLEFNTHHQKKLLPVTIYRKLKKPSDISALHQ